MKFRTGDNVVVITGKDKGKTGKIMKIMEKTDRVVVEKVNIRTRHLKKSSTRPGEIIKYEAPISASNVMLLDPKDGKRTRIGYKKLDDGKKVRIAKRSGQALNDKPTSKK